MADADHNYATIRTHLERQGTPIGSNDLLIAVQAFTLNLQQFEIKRGTKMVNFKDVKKIK
jgi:predicted nucleic acid-binding protein